MSDDSLLALQKPSLSGTIYDTWNVKPFTKDDLTYGSFYSEYSPAISNPSKINYGAKLSDKGIETIDEGMYVRRGRSRMNVLDTTVMTAESELSPLKSGKGQTVEKFVGKPYMTARTYPQTCNDYDIPDDDYTSNRSLSDIVNDGSDGTVLTKRVDGNMLRQNGNFLSPSQVSVGSNLIAVKDKAVETVKEGYDSLTSSQSAKTIMKCIIIIIVFFVLFYIIRSCLTRTQRGGMVGGRLVKRKKNVKKRR